MTVWEGDWIPAFAGMTGALTSGGCRRQSGAWCVRIYVLPFRVEIAPENRAMPIEPQLNGRIATLLDRMNPRWTALGENKGAFRGSQKQPDVVIAYRWGGQPVVIENEYVPARNVETESLAAAG